MDHPQSHPSPGAPVLSRRAALQLAGAATVATITGGCSTEPAASGVQSPSVRAAPSPVSVALPLSPPIPPVSTGVMLCRDAWGARPARPGGRPHTITRMTIHHSAVALPDNRGITARLRQHQRYHQDDKGWIDIAYHAAVDRNGNIFALRDTAIAGDTATDYDTTGHFLVLCEGDFDQETVSEAQLNGAALVCAWATKTFGISTATLASHQEVAAATNCPGRTLESHLVSGDLKRRIDDIASTGFSLNQACGPEAATLVASIEAGTR